MSGSVCLWVGGLCRVVRSLAYPAVAVQGRPRLTCPGVVVQGRPVWLQGVTAHSSPVASAVVSGVGWVQGKSIPDLPCRLPLEPRLQTALTARAAVCWRRDLSWEKATDFLFPEMYHSCPQPYWFGGWASVSQNIKSVCRDHTHTHYTFLVKVVGRTNRTISRATGTLRQREQNHRDQRVEEHITSWEQSGATGRGRFTLELVWPLALRPDPAPDLGRSWLPCSGSRGLGYPVVAHPSLVLTLSLASSLDRRLDSRLASTHRPRPTLQSLSPPQVPTVDSRFASVDPPGLFGPLQVTLQLTHGRPWVRSPRRASRVTL